MEGFSGGRTGTESEQNSALESRSDRLDFGSFPAVDEIIDAEVVGETLDRCVIVHPAVVRVHGRD